MTPPEFPPSSADSDLALVERTNAGDMRAFELLVIKYQRRIERLIGRMVRDVDLVPDIAQETFIRAYRALHQFRGDAQFYTWLYRIAVNTAKKALLDMKRSPLITESALHNGDDDDETSRLSQELTTEETPETILAAQEIAQAVNAAMEALPEDLRQAVTLREIEGLSLQAGQYREVSLRHSSDMQDLSAWAAPGVTSDGFNYAGAEYRFNQQRTLIGAWHSQLEDIYQQSYFNLLHSQRVGEWTLGANLGYFIDRDDGQARIGDIQSRTGYALLSASHIGHTLYLGLQKVSGDSQWMSVYGSSGRTLGNDMFNGNFSNADERSWQVRYDYNFTALGVPGLLAMVRYGHGENATTAAGSNGKEWERDTEVNYTFQSGLLKNLNIRLNNATNRRSFNSDFDQTRLIVSYPLTL